MLVVDVLVSEECQQELSVSSEVLASLLPTAAALRPLPPGVLQFQEVYRGLAVPTASFLFWQGVTPAFFAGD